MMNREDRNESLFGQIWNGLFGRRRAKDKDAAAYRRLALQLHYDAPQGGGGTRSAMLLSPTASPLSAPGALSLASSLAQELGSSVVLVDACTSQPEVTSMLGLLESPGWANLLEEDNTSLESVVLPTSTEGLWFLPAGRACGIAPSAIVLEAAAKALHQRFDFVLISGGSLLDEGSGLGLLPYLGCVLLMVTENETKVEELEAAQRALKLCRAQKVHLVLTSAVPAAESHSSMTQVRSRAQAQPVGKLVVE